MAQNRLRECVVPFEGPIDYEKIVHSIYFTARDGRPLESTCHPEA